jgi:hypothetical protein
MKLERLTTSSQVKLGDLYFSGNKSAAFIGNTIYSAVSRFENGDVEFKRTDGVRCNGIILISVSNEEDINATILYRPSTKTFLIGSTHYGIFE